VSSSTLSPPSPPPLAHAINTLASIITGLPRVAPRSDYACERAARVREIRAATAVLRIRTALDCTFHRASERARRVTRGAREEGRSHASRRATESADEEERERTSERGEERRNEGVGDGDDNDDEDTTGRGGRGRGGRERERPNGSETRGKIAIAVRTNELIRVT